MGAIRQTTSNWEYNKLWREHVALQAELKTYKETLLAEIAETEEMQAEIRKLNTLLSDASLLLTSLMQRHAG